MAKLCLIFIGLCLVGTALTSRLYRASERSVYSKQQPYVSESYVAGISPDEILLHLQYTILTCGDGNRIKCMADPSDIFGVGSCIPIAQRCNGVPDCPMGEDETDCPVQPVPQVCAANQVRCCDTGVCANVCDGVYECTFGQDEANCTGCTGGQVGCPEGTCANPCNSIPECHNGEDELRCGSGCLAGEIVCNDGVTCATRCDSMQECAGGEDETPCSELTCGLGQRACESNVPGELGEVCANMCDLDVECKDGSDEQFTFCKICVICEIDGTEECKFEDTCTE